jgi:hypothetical protein
VDRMAEEFFSDRVTENSMLSFTQKLSYDTTMFAI